MKANADKAVENVQLRSEVKGRYRFEEILGSSPALQKSLHLVERVLATDTTVLITGETGTGKELFARAYADNSDRRGKPYVPVPIPALAPTVIESELFGHVKGAFTEARQDKKGLAREPISANRSVLKAPTRRSRTRR